MDNLTNAIYNWLLEIEEVEAAEFISKCQIDSYYIDTLFRTDSDMETYMYEVMVSVPIKLYKKTDKYSHLISKIEEAIVEFGSSTGIYVKRIEWQGSLLNVNENKLHETAERISEILNQEYVKKQVRLMNQSIKQHPHLALGTAKELIETCCKHILSEKQISYDKDWDIQKLVKETNKVINLVPLEVENMEIAKIATAKILSGFSSIVHGITELRNSYGSGHGHEPNFKMIDEIYIKLAVSAAGELALFYLSVKELDLPNNNEVL